MTLIDSEHDDKAILQAEDDAIAAALHPTEEPPVPVGDDLDQLIQRVLDASNAPAPPQE